MSMALHAFVGTLGSGKTIALTWWAAQQYNKGRKIFSNYKLGFPHYKVTHPDQLDQMREGAAALDELWLWMDSRCSGDELNKMRTYVLGKSRKRKLDIGYTTQNLMQIDKRVRNVTDWVYAPYLPHNPEQCVDCMTRPTRVFRHPLTGETIRICSRPVPVVIEIFKMEGGNFGQVIPAGSVTIDGLKIIPLYDTTEEIMEDVYDKGDAEQDGDND